MQSVSTLSTSNLVLQYLPLASWQAREISRVLSHYDAEEEALELAQLTHISPIEWDNVILYGEYVINPKLIRSA